jgi:hypothetical protein
MNARNLITISMAGLFFIMAISGTSLFFHFQPGFFRELHEDVGIFFVAGACCHLFMNRYSFLKYLKTPILTCLLLVILLMGGAYGYLTYSPSYGLGVVVQAMSPSPLKNVAPAFGLSPEEAVSRLERSGIHADPAQTLQEIARQNGESFREILALIAQPK